MEKRATTGLSLRGRLRLLRAAVSPAPVLRSLFNPGSVSDIAMWRSIFGASVNQWGVHQHPFAEHPLVYRAITLIHNSASGVPIILSREQNGEMTPVTAGPEWQAVNRPSTYLSRASLVGSTAGLMQCDRGEAFWVIVKAGDARAIVLINPEAVEVERSRRSGELVYRITLDEGRQRVLEERDVIHFKTFNPIDPMRGQGPLAAANWTVTDDIDIRRHNRQMVRNGGLYRPVLMTDAPLPEKGSTEDQALEEQMTKLLGTPDNRGKVVILPNGLKLSDHAKTIAEMDYLESRKQNVKEIAGVFGVPPSKLGDYERDQADSEAQERDYWNDTMVPLLRYIADKIESDMWKLSGLARAADTGINVAFDFDTVPVLVRQKQSLWAGDTQDVQAGILTQNEVRRRRGLPDVPWGDVWWAPGLPVPISGAELPEIPGMTSDPNADPNADPAEPDGEHANDTGGKGATVVDLRAVAAKMTAMNDRDQIVLAGFVALQARFEGAAVRAINGVLASMQREVVANIRAAYKSVAVPEVAKAPDDVIQLLFDLDATSKATREAMRKPMREAQFAGGQHGLRMARSSATFSVDARPAIEYLQRQEARYVRDIAQKTWEALRDSLAEGLKHGESEAKLTNRVQQVLDVKRSQAAGIAHGEVNAAVNGGAELGFRQSRVVVSKRWLSALIETTRPEHRKAHGQTVGVDEDFTVANEQMAFPGDPRGSDSNVYGCLCTIEPILKQA